MHDERLIVVDDDAEVADGLRQVLEYEGYTVAVAGSKAAVEAALARSFFDLALVDLRLPDADGLEIMAMCQETDPAMALLMLTAYGTMDAAARAFQLGAKDFLTKPVRREDLLAAVGRALELSRVARAARGHQRQSKRKSSPFDTLVRRSSAMEDVVKLAAKAASSDISVLIRGETGTGKDVLAAAIHNASPRAKGHFVPVEIAGIPRDLQASALFGHLKGAFTGALTSERGLFEEADGGTLFLDEIGEIALESQVALLRALERRLIRPIGAADERSVDVRLLCATNRDLAADIESGAFRLDLYHRIAVLEITMPPLRERLDDVPALASHFAQQFGKGGAPSEISSEAMDVLMGYEWPGNVRELRNVMERAVLLAEGDAIQARHCMIGPGPKPSEGLDGLLSLPLAEAEAGFARMYLERLRVKTAGDKAEMAKCAQVHVTTIRRRMRELHVE